MSGGPADVAVVDGALAARAEGALVDDLAVFVRGVAAADSGVGARRFRTAGGWASYTGLFGSRVQGAGLDGPVAPVHVDEAERFFDEVNVPAEFEVCPLADASLWRELADRGYRLVGFRNVYGTGPGLAGSSAAALADGFSAIACSLVDECSFEAWSEILLDGFGYQDDDTRTRVDRWNRMVSTNPRPRCSSPRSTASRWAPRTCSSTDRRRRWAARRRCPAPVGEVCNERSWRRGSVMHGPLAAPWRWSPQIPEGARRATWNEPDFDCSTPTRWLRRPGGGRAQPA